MDDELRVMLGVGKGELCLLRDSESRVIGAERSTSEIDKEARKKPFWRPKKMAADTEDRNLSAEAREIFTYWQNVTKHPRSRLDDRRSKTIIARLKDGYSKDDLKLAVFGCAHSRFHQGENERRQVFDSIELICRNADKVDQFMKHGELELWRREERKRAETQQRAETLQASVPGDGYRTARGQLLQLIKKSA